VDLSSGRAIRLRNGDIADLLGLTMSPANAL
jgi:hypothetical protein